MVIDVEFYELPDGSEPVREFLNSLEPKMHAKMLREIDLLVENGPELRLPHSKPVEDGIFELRAKQGSDISRVLYFFFIGQKAILTNGFVKKRRKPLRVKSNSQNSIDRIIWNANQEVRKNEQLCKVPR